MDIKKEEAQKVQVIIQNLNESVDESLTIDENLAQFYLTKCPGIFPEDAYDVVKKLHSGLDWFNAELRKALDHGDLDYNAELESLTKDMSIKQKYDLYLNFLSALLTLNASNLSAWQMESIENFKTIKGRLKSTGAISEDNITELKKLISEQLQNNTLCIGTTDAFRNLITHLPEGEKSVERIVIGSEKDVKVKLIASMATYIAYQNGELESLKEQNMTPESIAIAVATGIEENHVLSDFHSGNITVDKVIKLLKIIGGVALVTLFAVSAIPFVSSAVGFAFASVTGILGVSTVAMIIAGLYAFSFGLIVSDAFVEGSCSVVQLASRTFDAIVETCRNKIFPTISATIIAGWNWLTDKLSGGAVVEQDNKMKEIIVTTN